MSLSYCVTLKLSLKLLEKTKWNKYKGVEINLSEDSLGCEQNDFF